MNVQFYAGTKRPARAMTFVNAKKPTVVRLLCGPREWVRVWLHYHNGRSVACQGSQCHFCQEEPRLYAYGAARLARWVDGKFRSADHCIVCVGAASWQLTEGDYRDSFIELRRNGASHNAELTYRVIEPCREPLEPPFSIRERLLTLWAIRDREDTAERQRAFEMIDNTVAELKSKFGLPAAAADERGPS